MRRRIALPILISAFQLFSVSAFALSLQWDANPATDLVTKYNVYEHVGSNYNLVGSVNAPTTTFALTNLSPGAHIYAVTAVNITGESINKSSEVTVPALPSAPANLRISP